MKTQQAVTDTKIDELTREAASIIILHSVFLCLKIRCRWPTTELETLKIK
jgi:hypothetical protein